MIIEDFVAEQLARVEEHLGELEAMPDRAGSSPDVYIDRFAAHTLQLAIQRCCTVAVHIAVGLRANLVCEQSPGTKAVSEFATNAVPEAMPNKQAVNALAHHGWIERDLATQMEKLINIRNHIVHRSPQAHNLMDHILSRPPAQLDAIIEQAVGKAFKTHLSHFREFIRVIRGRLSNPKVRGDH